MTTATLNPPVPEARASAVHGRLSFDGVLRSEWIKLLSLRSIRWSIVVMIALSFGGAAMMSFALRGTDMITQETLPSMVVQAATFGSVFTVLIMGVLGVLAVTSEYASGLILSSLTAVPSRTPLLAAKALVVASMSLLLGAISVFGSGLLAAVVIGDGAMEAYLKPESLLSMLGATLYLTLASLMALGIGALLRSSAGAISIVVVLLFVATIVFQVLGLTGWEWIPEVAKWMPADLGHTLSSAAMVPADAVTEGSVGYWGALGGLAAWAAAALVPAGILLKTRDAV